jgi:hypothetical protein
MKTMLATAAACFAIPGMAFAAGHPAMSGKRCFENMKVASKSCCSHKDQTKIDRKRGPRPVPHQKV